MNNAEDRIIWDLPSGSKIKSSIDLHEELNPELPKWFTAGEIYVVDSMHPIADPPFIKVNTDMGFSTRLYAEHIKAHFLKA